MEEHKRGTVKLWDSTAGVLKQTLKRHSGGVEAVAFSPDGRLLASGSRDKISHIGRYGFEDFVIMI